MQLHRLTLSVLGCLMLSAPLALAQNAPIPKQLAGPPAEFALMAPADPAEATIHSKSALIPIRMHVDKAGGMSWNGELPVENGRARFLVFGGEHGSWNVDLTAPSGGTQKAAALLAKDIKRAEFGMEQERHAADYYALDGVERGAWQVKLRAGIDANPDGFLLIEGDAGTELASYQTHKRQLLGQHIGLVAMLTSAESDEAPKLGAAAGRIETATLRITAPDGTVETKAMFDDGKHDDAQAGDGVYGAGFQAKASGQYLAQVLVRGVDRHGNPVLRSAEHVLPIVDASLQLAGSKASGLAASGTRVSIDVPVASDKRGQHYRAYAEVWGSDAQGKSVPVAWIGGMVTPVEGRMTLGFDERWTVLAGAQAPFELRKLRIEDPDTSITVADAARLPLTLPAIRTKTAADSIKLDDESLRMGPRPPVSAYAKGTGSRLVLVHGYCSGGVWPTSNFSSASTFLDANKNRSHDAFARLLQTYGNTWNSFGVVAHSQGGAASLHLYNYYWSGLDNATGSRLIQSVGTPYKGTNLSGVLAALGGIFGVGCGTNSDMTYSGASSWLAGISTASRAKVNFYTTAFRTTNWWTNDYCNFASDLVLSDPEDGTVEKVNGQLSGGVNRGHTSGQCHTAGMRDPAQYQDSSRNATMNSNAAR